MLSTREIIAAVKKIEIKTRRAVDELTGGAYHSVFKGRGMEFNEVREYAEGDDIRTIDWNVTARTGSPHVKQYVEERELTIFVLVDISGSSDFGAKRTRMQCSIELACLIAFSAIRNKDRVGLMLHSQEEELHLPARRGRQHVLRLTRELVVHDRKNKNTCLRTALERLMQVQRKKAVVFLISDLMDKDFDKALRAVSQRHDLIVINILDAMEQELPNDLPPMYMVDAETEKKAFLKHNKTNHEQFSERSKDFIEANKKLCISAGADLITLRTDEDLVSALMRFFTKRELRR